MAGAESSLLNVRCGSRSHRLRLDDHECAGDLPNRDRQPTGAIDPELSIYDSESRHSAT